MCVGGPALVYYVSPTEEEIFKVHKPCQTLDASFFYFWYNVTNIIASRLIKKYNPELQKRSLETRQEREEEINNFLLQLKENSRSDKNSEGSLFSPSFCWPSHAFIILPDF